MPERPLELLGLVAQGLGDQALSARSGPLYRRIYRSVASAVLDGRLTPGTRLPSTRSLAAQLGVARGTVDTAYQMLASEGYVVGLGAAGTVVNRQLAAGFGGVTAGDVAAPAAPGSEAARVVASRGDASPANVFKMGMPALDAFPAKLLARLLARQARQMEGFTQAYQEPAGLPLLRRQIAAYLAVARGIDCSADQVIVSYGYQGALGLIARVLVRDGDLAWVEDPGYPSGREAMRLAGARIEGVPVDEQGMRVDLLPGKGKAAKLVLLTPTHHFPLGHTLSLARRAELLRWAEQAGAWIVEDDYDSEFRYVGQPLPALKSLDRDDRVLYVGTFSKVLSPSIGIGYLVAPRSLIEPLTEAAERLQPPPAAVIQAAIATFLEEGHLGRHVRRMRRLYAERRDALLHALREATPWLEVAVQPGGMHLNAYLPEGTNDVQLVERLRGRGFEPSALSAYGVEAPFRPGLLLGFTNVPAEEARATAEGFAEVLRIGHDRTLAFP